jgi:glycosyltransferase involved in cell wall biosynthesis
MSGAVLFDGQKLTAENATGIGTYTRTLAETVRSLGFKTEILVGGNAPISKKDPQLSEIEFFDALIAKRAPLSVLAERLLARVVGKPFGVKPGVFERVGAVYDPGGSKLSGFERTYVMPSVFDLANYHFKLYRNRVKIRLGNVPSLFHLSYPVPLRVPGCPNIYTIHDLVPMRLPQTTLDNKRHYLRLLRHLCAKADHIVTVSEFSRRDIIQFVGISEDRITNCYESVYLPDNLVNKTDDEVSAEIAHAFNLGFHEYYIFFGAIEPKKNIARLIDGFAASGSPYPLLIVGGLGWQYKDDLEKIEEERFLAYSFASGGRLVPDRRVRRIPYLPLAQLVSLIKGTRGVLFPSLYEGFGLPVLEAMLLGTPVITSNVSALPEISGDAALLVDPNDVDSIADAVRKLDADAELRAELANRGRKRAAYFSRSAYELRIESLYRRLGVEAKSSQERP